MASILDRWQWEISALDGSRSLVFGTKGTGILTLSRPSMGGLDQKNGDVDMPREDGVALGVDYRGGRTITFECGVMTDQDANAEVANLDLLDTFEGLWTDPWFREKSGRVALLRCNEAGRTRRTYGRPRRYSEANNDLTKDGYTEFVCDFQSLDGLFYDDTESVLPVGLVPPTTPGIVSPIVSPLTSIPLTEFSGAAVNTGGRETWAVATIHGPVTNPVVDFGSWRLGLLGSLIAGQTVTLDPRPWQRTVLRSDGANLAGLLTHFTPPMRDWKLQPGSTEVTYSGIDATGSSYVEISWRSAHSRP